MTKYIAAILLALLLVSCAAPAPTDTQNQAAQAEESASEKTGSANAQNLYYYVRPQLTNKSIPLHLPSYIPPGKEEIAKEGLVAQITAEGEEESTDDAYYKLVIAQPNCGDTTACTYASMGGFKPTENTPSLEERLEERLSPDLEFSEEAPFPPGKVELTQGIQGYLFPWFIGAYQTETQVFWQEDGYRYWVGVRGASKDEIIRMANSAINDEGGRK